MKTKEKIVLSLTIIIFLSCVIIGCKKKENNYWPQGLSGKFVFSTLDNYTWDAAVYFIDENGIKKVFTDFWEINVNWSQDGSKALINTYNRTSFIIMNADGKVSKQIEGHDPVFSSDGTKIAFIYNMIGGPWDSVRTINVDGSSLLFLNIIPGSLSHLVEWSPDGTSIAFYKLTGDLEPDSIGIVNTNSSILLTKGYNPRWSPDGLKLYYLIGNELNQASAIESITISDHSVQKLADLPENIHLLSKWSLDKSKIAFESISSIIPSIPTLYVMKMDGSGSTKLYDIDSLSWDFPCWSLDGSKIAVRNKKGITVINADGSNAINLPIAQYIDLNVNENIYSFDWH